MYRLRPKCRMPKLRYRIHGFMRIAQIMLDNINNYIIFIFQVSEVLLVEDESPVKYSVDTVFFTDNYEVV